MISKEEDEELKAIRAYAAACFRHLMALPERIDSFDNWVAGGTSEQIEYAIDCAHVALCHTTLDEDRRDVAMQAIYAMFDAAKQRGAERKSATPPAGAAERISPSPKVKWIEGDEVRVVTREGAIIRASAAESGYVVTVDDGSEVPVPADARRCGELRLELPSGVRVIVRTEPVEND